MLVVSAVSSAGAQQANESTPGLSLLEASGVLRTGDIEAIERDEVVVRRLSVADRDEVALVGLVRASVPRAFYVAHTANVAALRAEPGRQSFGVLRMPPVRADFSTMTLDPSDAAGMRNCRVSRCSIKLPAHQMAMISGLLDRSGESAPSAVDSLMREWLFGLVTDYDAQGDAALPIYDDTRPGERSAAGFRQLLAEDAFMFRDAPTFAAYVAESPSHPVAGATSTICWASDRRPGLKPILSVSQLSTFHGSGVGAPMFVATKQLYASHYFDAWLDVATLLDGPSSEPSTYVVLVRRVRFDHLPSRGLFDVRGRVVRKLRDALREELTRTKQSVEDAYGAR